MKTEIIAEIAQGYEGKPLLAELLVKGAILAGADAVKIQMVYADELCVPSYPYFGLFRSLEMKESVWQELVKAVHNAKRKIYFDIYGEKSLRIAKKLKADGIKISATDFYNTDLIKEALKTFPKVFVSASGVPYEDLLSLVNSVTNKRKLTLMHGFQAEPTETPDNNLMRIGKLKTTFQDVSVGFMDHSAGSGDEAIYLPLMALGQGVSCIEKHITLEYSLQIEDYISALSVDRFKEFVTIVRKMEPALGSVAFELIDKEVLYKKRAGKVVVAIRDLKKGQLIQKTDITLKRVSVTPSDLTLSRKEEVIGKKILKTVGKNNPIENTMLK